MYLSHWVGFDGITDDKDNPFTIQANRREAELTLEKLADLIDPTCHVVIPNEMDGECFCSECGALLGEYGYTTYCPNCGARVTGGGDA